MKTKNKRQLGTISYWSIINGKYNQWKYSIFRSTMRSNRKPKEIKKASKSNKSIGSKLKTTPKTWSHDEGEDPGSAVQKDWDQREWIANVSTDVIRITTFLNKFEITMRDSLAKLNDKLVQLERQLVFLDARLLTLEQNDTED